MKLLYTFLGVAVLVLAGTSFYYTNIKKADTKFIVATSTPQTELIYIYKEYGDVAFKNKSASTFTQVTDAKMTIGNFATVKTEDGRGYVIFPDNSSITLSSSTEIEISYEPTKISILQLLGSTYHRVTALATGNKYEVRTPNTLAAVRGTKLAVTYNPKTKKTFVAVTEHRVEVTPTKENGAADNAPVMLQEGSVADVQTSTTTPKNSTSTSSGSSKMVVKNNDEVKEMKPFLEENKVIDKEFDKPTNTDKRVFLEKIINTLQKEDNTAPETDDKAQIPKKPETRIDILNRVMKQTTSKETSQDTPPSTKEPAPVVTKTPAPVTEPTKSETPPAITSTRTLKDLPTNVEEFTPEQEAFIDTFYTAYEKYFFVDDVVTYCKKVSALSAKEMVTSLLAVSNSAGYVLPKQTELTSFATDLITACKDGNMTDKAQAFKTRFDIAYPY
jgi:hypothetical protein